MTEGHINPFGHATPGQSSPGQATPDHITPGQATPRRDLSAEISRDLIYGAKELSAGYHLGALNALNPDVRGLFLEMRDAYTQEVHRLADRLATQGEAGQEPTDTNLHPSI